MEERYGNIRAGAKGFVRYQDKSGTELAKRQIICFSGAAVAGIPLYFLTKGLIGTSAHHFL